MNVGLLTRESAHPAEFSQSVEVGGVAELKLAYVVPSFVPHAHPDALPGTTGFEGDAQATGLQTVTEACGLSNFVCKPSPRLAVD